MKKTLMESFFTTPKSELVDRFDSGAEANTELFDARQRRSDDGGALGGHSFPSALTARHRAPVDFFDR